MVLVVSALKSLAKIVRPDVDVASTVCVSLSKVMKGTHVRDYEKMAALNRNTLAIDAIQIYHIFFYIWMF